MTRWSSDPEAAAQALIASWLEEDALATPLLWAGAAMPEPGGASGAGPVTHWNRRFSAGAPGTVQPPPGPFATVLLRLPKSRAEQEMTAHLCLGVLAPEGRLIVYGGNDEGVRSAQKNVDELGRTTTLATRGHGRVFELRRQDVSGPIKPRPSDWRQTHAPVVGVAPWVSYPGLFAGGTPDPGTALLLAHVPPLAHGADVLDYGGGPGAIGDHLLRAQPGASLTLLDNDSVALLAAAENVPGATLVAGDCLDAVPSHRFALIVSNPPLHVGFREDTAMLFRLIADAPQHLAANGALLLVVQRRIPLERTLAAAFRTVERRADDGRYCVWHAAGVAAKSSRPV